MSETDAPSVARVRSAAERLATADEVGGLALLDRDGAVRGVSAALGRLLGYAPEGLRGRRFVGLLSGEDRPRWRRHLRTAHEEGGALLPLPCRLQRAEGDWRRCAVRVTLLEDGSGELATALTVHPLAADADSWGAAEPRNDPATGLPGRAVLLDRLGLAMARGQRRPHCRFALLLAAMEGPADEQAVAESAARLRSLLGVGDLLVRLGGATFALLLDDVADTAMVERTAQGLTSALTGSGEDSRVRVGVVLGEAAGGRPQALLATAVRAVQAARAQGRGVAWAPLGGARGTNPLAAAGQELRQAIERGELRLHYQPLLDLHQATIVGVEALVRWRHPTRGLLAPSAFLPLAEASGLAVPLGRWVLREACRQLAAWQASFAPCRELRLCVNLAGEQLVEPGFAEEVGALLAATGVDAGCLWLEVGEAALLADREAGVAALRELRERGVQVSLDDCASAAAARAALRSLPLDRLKIDGALIAAVGTGGDAEVRTIAALAHSAGKEVIAEGVETAEQLALLRAVACDYEQGYLCAKPLPAGALQHILAGQR